MIELFIWLVGITIWLGAGTITFKRTGFYAVESAKTYHSLECKRNRFRCMECGERKRFGDTDHNVLNHVATCSSSPFDLFGRSKAHSKPKYKEVCSCYSFRDKWLRLLGVGLLTYTLFPVLWVVWGGYNGAKKFTLSRGADWRFFVKPPMVQSREEKNADFEKRMVAIKEATDKLELDIKKPVLRETSDEF